MRNIISIENATIMFKNFSGKQGRYNNEGNRNFCVLLDDAMAKELTDIGVNVRWLEPRDPEDDRQAYMQVKVSYRFTEPKIVMVTSHGKTMLHEDTVGSLDWADLTNVDLSFTLSRYDYNGKTGMKPYVHSLWATIAEDPFESKYYDAPDSAESAIGGCGNCNICTGDCKHED